MINGTKNTNMQTSSGLIPRYYYFSKNVIPAINNILSVSLKSLGNYKWNFVLEQSFSDRN